MDNETVNKTIISLVAFILSSGTGGGILQISAEVIVIQAGNLT